METIYGTSYGFIAAIKGHTGPNTTAGENIQKITPKYKASDNIMAVYKGHVEGDTK